MGQLEDSQVVSADNVPAFMTFQSKDPTEALRFVPPRTPPPFQEKSLVLKQTDPTRLDEIGRRAMSLFSSFVVDYWEENRARWVEDAKPMLASLSAEGGEHEIRTDVRPNRCFSGDGFLSRNRYYSLCESADGRDGGTMKRELIAYHNPWTTGVLDIRDLTDRSAEGAQLFSSLTPEMVTEPRLTILVSIPPFTATEFEWLYDAAKRWKSSHVELPLSVTQVRFQRLIDLRVPWSRSGLHTI